MYLISYLWTCMSLVKKIAPLTYLMVEELYKKILQRGRERTITFQNERSLQTLGLCLVTMYSSSAIYKQNNNYLRFSTLDFILVISMVGPICLDCHIRIL